MNAARNASGPDAVPSVAVVICAYTEDRWSDLVAAYGSLTAQTSVPDEIVVVIDHNDALLVRLRNRFPAANVVRNRGSAGLSGARNTGIEATSADIVLFLDDDAVAHEDWVRLITEPFGDPTVQGVAGWATANWDKPGRPQWFPEPFLWVVGCSYEGLPVERADIRNPIGCAMGFRRAALMLAGGFSSSIGRVGAHPVGDEETELAIRIRQLDPTARVVMVPEAIVRHRVTGNRRSLKYFVRRCYWEGVSKAVISASVGAQDALESERSYTTKVLPRAFGRGLVEAVRGDGAGIARSAAVVTGLVVTATGFLRGRLSGRRATAPAPPANRSLQRLAPDAGRSHPIPEQRQGAA